MARGIKSPQLDKGENMLGGIIGGALGAIGKTVGMGLQAHQNKKNQEREDQIRKETWNREDNAVQRRAKDMEKAGINPLLAAGDPAQASTGGGVTGGTAPDAEGLGGAIAQAGQWTDQMALAKKQQILQEQKTDAEIDKLEAETAGKLKENEGADDRNEQTRLQNEKIKREQEKVSAEIEAINANTELTKEKKISEIQQRLKDSFIEIGEWEIEGSAGIGGIGGKASRKEKIFKRIDQIAEEIADGKKTPAEAQTEIDELMKGKNYTEEEKQNLKKLDEKSQENLLSYRDYQGY